VLRLRDHRGVKLAHCGPSHVDSPARRVVVSIAFVVMLVPSRDAPGFSSARIRDQSTGETLE